MLNPGKRGECNAEPVSAGDSDLSTHVQAHSTDIDYSALPFGRFTARQLAARAHYFVIALRDSEENGSLRNPRHAREIAQMWVYLLHIALSIPT